MRVLLWLLLWLLLVVVGCHGDETQILKDTVWSQEEGLEVTEQVTVFPGATLTIRGDRAVARPMPVMLGSGGFRVHSEASLVMDYVVLSGNHDVDAVRFVSTNGGLVNWTSVVCRNVSTCIARNDGNLVHVRDSIFAYNDVALSGPANEIPVQDSLFVANNVAIDGVGVVMEGCVMVRNEKAAIGASFRRCVFLENRLGARDSGQGEGTLFCEDCLFVRNRNAVTPNPDGSPHAAMHHVTFLENRIALSCASSMGAMEGVNLINSKSWNLVYTGKAISEPTTTIYWGSTNDTEIRSGIYDAYKGSTGGIVRLQGSAQQPYHHNLYPQDFVVEVQLAHYLQDTPLLLDLDTKPTPMLPAPKEDPNVTHATDIVYYEPKNYTFENITLEEGTLGESGILSNHTEALLDTNTTQVDAPPATNETLQEGTLADMTQVPPVTNETLQEGELTNTTQVDPPLATNETLQDGALLDTNTTQVDAPLVTGDDNMVPPVGNNESEVAIKTDHEETKHKVEDDTVVVSKDNEPIPQKTQIGWSMFDFLTNPNVLCGKRWVLPTMLFLVCLNVALFWALSLIGVAYCYGNKRRRQRIRADEEQQQLIPSEQPSSRFFRLLHHRKRG